MGGRKLSEVKKGAQPAIVQGYDEEKDCIGSGSHDEAELPKHPIKEEGTQGKVCIVRI